jgi:hypothetical protein
MHFEITFRIMMLIFVGYMEFWFWIVLLSATQNRYIGELDKCK